MKIAINNAQVIDPGNDFEQVTNVYLADNKLVAIQPKLADFEPDEILDATDQIVMPGAIDLYATIPEPGFEYKATIASETYCALQSGITTVCCAPTTKPVIDTTAVVELINARNAS